MKESRITTIAAMVTTALFVTAVWMPNIGTLVMKAPGDSPEQRLMAQRPKLKANFQSIVSYPSAYMRYYADNFGFRNFLIRTNSLFKLNVLKVDQFPKVLVGKEGWLYLIKDDEGNNSLDYYRSLSIFSGEKEMADWARPLADIKKYLDRRNIRMLVVFVPMKPRVYPEFVPDYLKPVRKETRLDQMMKYLKERTDINVVDAGPAVIAGKKEHLVFIKHDVHWNGYGAYYAYRAIVEKLSAWYPGIKPLTLDDFLIQSYPYIGGDLANMLGLKDRFSEKGFTFYQKGGWKVKLVKVPYAMPYSRFSEAIENIDQSKPKAVVFHDSFFNFLKPYVAQHFRRMACFQSYSRFDPAVIDIEKPDLVIFEIAEHFLLKSPAYIESVKL